MYVCWTLLLLFISYFFFSGRMNPEAQAPVQNNPVTFVQGTNLTSAGNFYRDSDNSQSMEEDGMKKSEVWVRGQKRPEFGNMEAEFGPQPSKMARMDVTQESKMNYGFEKRRIQFDIRRVIESGPFGKVVVFQSALTKEENPVCIIQRTASAAQMTSSFDFRIENNGV